MLKIKCPEECTKTIKVGNVPSIHISGALCMLTLSENPTSQRGHHFKSFTLSTTYFYLPEIKSY
jgi:hypothetical protein